MFHYLWDCKLSHDLVFFYKSCCYWVEVASSWSLWFCVWGCDLILLLDGCVSKFISVDWYVCYHRYVLIFIILLCVYVPSCHLLQARKDSSCLEQHKTLMDCEDSHMCSWKCSSRATRRPLYIGHRATHTQSNCRTLPSAYRFRRPRATRMIRWQLLLSSDAIR